MSATVGSPIRPADPPLRGGDFHRPQVAISIGLEWRFPPARALDGTKVQGHASLDANRTAASIKAEIEKILAEAEATDAKEDSQSAAQQGAALPKALARRADRLARLRQCQEKLQRRAAAAAARQQAKIDARQAEEQATGKRKRGRKPKPADPSIDPDANACLTDPTAVS